MMRYFETFFRHKLLLCAPVVIALVLGVGYQTKQPAKYESTARMWLDSPLPSPSSVDQPSASPPSVQHQSLLSELLATRAFDVRIADRMRVVAPPGTQIGADDQIIQSLAHQVSTSIPGPQVLALTFTARSQGLAVATGRAVIDEFMKEITSTRSSRGAALSDYYQARADGAAKALQDANAKLASYMSAHPVTAAQPVDNVATQLAQAAAVAQQQFNTMQDNLNQASINVTRVADTNVLHIIDAPSVPDAPLGGKKRIVLVGVGAGFAGAIISMLVLIWLTASDSSLRRGEDVERLLGVGVVGVIQPFAASRRKAKPSGSA